MSANLGSGSVLLASNDLWLPSGLVVAAKSKQILFSLQRRAELARERSDALQVYPLGSLDKPRLVGEFSGGVDAIALAADGASFLAAGLGIHATETIRFVSLPGGQILQSLEGFATSAGRIFLAEFSSDGRFLLLGVVKGRSEQRLLVFDLATKTILHELDTDKQMIQQACFSPDSSLVLIRLGSRSALSKGMEENEQEFRLFEIRQDRLRKRSFGQRAFPGHAHHVGFLPDQSAILIAFEAFARIARDAHALLSWIEVVDLKGSSQGRFQHTDPFWLCSTFAVSADGKTLVTGSGDRAEDAASSHPYQLDVWDVASGDLRFHSEGLRSSVCKVALAPEGTGVFVAEEDASLRYFSLQPLAAV